MVALMAVSRVETTVEKMADESVEKRVALTAVSRVE